MYLSSPLDGEFRYTFKNSLTVVNFHRVTFKSSTEHDIQKHTKEVHSSPSTSPSPKKLKQRKNDVVEEMEVDDQNDLKEDSHASKKSENQEKRDKKLQKKQQKKIELEKRMEEKMKKVRKSNKGAEEGIQVKTENIFKRGTGKLQRHSW